MRDLLSLTAAPRRMPHTAACYHGALQGTRILHCFIPEVFSLEALHRQKVAGEQVEQGWPAVSSRPCQQVRVSKQ